MCYLMPVFHFLFSFCCLFHSSFCDGLSFWLRVLHQPALWAWTSRITFKAVIWRLWLSQHLCCKWVCRFSSRCGFSLNFDLSPVFEYKTSYVFYHFACWLVGWCGVCVCVCVNSQMRKFRVKVLKMLILLFLDALADNYKILLFMACNFWHDTIIQYESALV